MLCMYVGSAGKGIVVFELNVRGEAGKGADLVLRM